MSGFDLSSPLATSQRIRSWIKAIEASDMDVVIISPTPVGSLGKDYESNRISLKHCGRNLSIARNAFTAQFLRAVALVRCLSLNLRKDSGYVQITGGSLAGIAAIVGMSRYVLDLPDLDFARQVFNNKVLQTLYERFTESLQRLGARRAAAILCVSESMRAYLASRWRVREDKMLVIPNGYYKAQVREAANHAEIPGMVSYAGYLGEYVDAKLLVQTAKEIEDIGGVLHIVGEGPAKALIMSLAHQAGSKNIRFSGILPLETATTISAESQVVVSPLRQTFHTRTCCPTKIIQYAAMGKAIVSTAVSDVVLTLKEKNAAVVVNSDDSSTFAKSVRNLLTDSDLRRAVGIRASLVFKEFDWDCLSKRLVRLYKV